MKIEDIISELEEARDELNLSQEDMARKLNVSLRTYTKWLEGTKPSGDNLLKIMELLEENEGERNE